jgi:hypothetical protein
VARDPALRRYRIGVYVAYGLVCTVVFVQLVRSVVGDLYGRKRDGVARESAMACLDDVEQLYGELSARAVQPAPRGLESGALSREWDAWSRRWEDDIEGVSERCRLESSSDPSSRHLAEALDGIEELRRRLSRSGEDASADARKVKEALAEARKALRTR